MISKSFKKIRISKPNVHLRRELNKLFEKRERLKLKISKNASINTVEANEDKSNLKDVENEIAEANAEENFNFMKKNIEHLVDDTENVNCIKMWQLKKKLCSNKFEPPTAKKNEQGELVTEPSKLKDLYVSTYKKRLEHRKIKPELQNLYQLKMNLFNIRFDVCKNIKTEKWSMRDLIKVLKGLKKNKSSDSQGLIYELFRPEIIGSDLLNSLLMLCNNMKTQLAIPDFVTFTDITSIYKSG